MSDDFHKQNTQPGWPSNSTLPASLKIPKTIGPYKIESLLDKGGMSILYLGTHQVTNEPTIIKVLSPKYLSHPDVVKRFFNEAEIIAMADHPHIIKMYGHGQWEEGLYIAMEYIEGISLRQYLLQNPLSLKHALEMIIDISYALCHLHTHGVIHRDLKPENVLVTNSGGIKVIDFGIAQLQTDLPESKTGTSQRLIGTPIYMSPEQRKDPESVSYPSDIYSLGIISYELILGKLSHGQIHLSLMPKGMQKIFNKALQPNPKDRYLDVVDFISDVSIYLTSPDLDKDKKAGDRLSELLENLRKAQNLLINDHIPAWTDLEIGIAIQKTVNVTGVYLDFFDLPHGHQGIFMAESSAREAEGFVYTSMLRGMVRALYMLSNKPMELLTILNELLIRDAIPHLFNISYLVLNPTQNNLTYISCGYGNFWKIDNTAHEIIKIENDNIAIGINPYAEFKQLELPWKKDDKIILSNFAGMLSNPSIENQFDATRFKEVLENNAELDPQKLVDVALLKAKISSQKFGMERSVSIVCLKRL